MTKLGPQHVFWREVCIFYGRTISQNDREIAKTKNFQVFHTFRQFFKATLLSSRILTTNLSKTFPISYTCGGTISKKTNRGSQIFTVFLSTKIATRKTPETRKQLFPQ